MHSFSDKDCGLSYFRGWVGLVIIVCFSGDTVACLVSGGELTWFSMCILLVTWTVACLVSGSELGLF